MNHQITIKFTMFMLRTAFRTEGKEIFVKSRSLLCLSTADLGPWQIFGVPPLRVSTLPPPGKGMGGARVVGGGGGGRGGGVLLCQWEL